MTPRGRVGAAPPKGRDLVLDGASPLEARHDDDPAGLDLGPDPGRLDTRDAGLAVAAVGGDAGLRAGQADGRDTEAMERHRQERRALVLAGREQDVQLARVGLVGDGRRERQELVGGVAHRGHHDDELRPARALAHDPPRDALHRLDTMIAMANLNLPDKAIRHQVASAINVIVQVSRFSDGNRRVTSISESVAATLTANWSPMFGLSRLMFSGPQKPEARKVGAASGSVLSTSHWMLSRSSRGLSQLWPSSRREPQPWQASLTLAA